VSSELERWASPSSQIVPSRDERNSRRAVERLVRETRFAGLQVDAEAALTGRIMERAVDNDSYRKQLANGDPVLDAVLTRIEVNFVDKASRIQRNFGSAFPL
jgi:predicted kinase